MSRKIKSRVKELAAKEAEMKKGLLRKSSGIKSKANAAGKTALIGGLIALLVYGLYRAFVQGDEKKSKKAKTTTNSASTVVAEKVTTFLLPYLGKLLDGFLAQRSARKENTETREEKAESDDS